MIDAITLAENKCRPADLTANSRTIWDRYNVTPTTSKYIQRTMKIQTTPFYF